MLRDKVSPLQNTIWRHGSLGAVSADGPRTALKNEGAPVRRVTLSALNRSEKSMGSRTSCNNHGKLFIGGLGQVMEEAWGSDGEGAASTSSRKTKRTTPFKRGLKISDTESTKLKEV